MVGILGRDGVRPADLGHTSPWRWAQPPPDRLSEIVVRRARFFRVAVLAGVLLADGLPHEEAAGSMSNCSVLGLLADADTRLATARTELFRVGQIVGYGPAFEVARQGVTAMRGSLTWFRFRLQRWDRASLRALTETVLQGGIHLGAVRRSPGVAGPRDEQLSDPGVQRGYVVRQRRVRVSGFRSRFRTHKPARSLTRAGGSIRQGSWRCS